MKYPEELSLYIILCIIYSLCNYRYIKCHWTVYFKWVNCICELHSNNYLKITENVIQQNELDYMIFSHKKKWYILSLLKYGGSGLK